MYAPTCCTALCVTVCTLRYVGVCPNMLYCIVCHCVCNCRVLAVCMRIVARMSELPVEQLISLLRYLKVTLRYQRVLIDVRRVYVHRCETVLQSRHGVRDGPAQD